LSVSEELLAGTLDLWVLRVADVDATQLDVSMLDDDERRRAATLAVPDDRWRYVASHLIVRYLLGSYLGVPPRSVAYFREPCPCCGAPHGRPSLHRPTRPLHFSLSRSGGLALIGIASDPVGVDVEAISQRDTVTEVSPLLHPAERTEILSAVPSKRAAAFTRIWTRKEAYLKGVGVGVTRDLTADYLGTEQQAAPPLGWTVVAAPVPAGYVGAAAVQGQWSGGSN
jgi:4'-phosphopantetheinyl transferase